MAVDPSANATWITAHTLPLNVNDLEIIGGIGETVVSITNEASQANQRLNLTAPVQNFGIGQNVTIKNGIGLWVEFSVRTASGANLALKPTTQKV